MFVIPLFQLRRVIGVDVQRDEIDPFPRDWVILNDRFRGKTMQPIQAEGDQSWTNGDQLHQEHNTDMPDDRFEEPCILLQMPHIFSLFFQIMFRPLAAPFIPPGHDPAS